MVSFVSLVIVAAISYGIYSYASGLAQNIARAKRSGLPYYVTPISPINLLGQVLAWAWIPIFKLLPRSYWEDIELILDPAWHYRENHKPFAKLGDSFLVASPGGIALFTASAEAIHQITARREAFPKSTKEYQLLSQYGQNVLTTEGAIWRMHRKTSSASFNEKNAALVFSESIEQTQWLMRMWLGADGKGNRTIKTMEHDIMALTLHIIGYVGFGLRLLWPGQELPPDTDPKLIKYSTLDPPEGHTLNFIDAVAKTLDHLLLLMLVPKSILRLLPFKTTKKALDAEKNYLKFMQEFLQDKIEDVNKEGKQNAGMDIMGQLVRTSYGDKQSSTKGKSNEVLGLTDDEIIGNAFIMLVAGHETTANILHFTLLELANNPAVQRSLQRDVDRIFGTTDPATWDYETCVNPLLASMVGACMNETLRTVPPVVEIPKMVAGEGQELVIDGKKVLIPGGGKTYIGLTAVAVHRNPRYWPTKPSDITGAATDIDDYVPERWFRTDAAGAGDNAAVEGADTEDFGGFSGPDTSAQLFRPPRGSYLPFSDGARSCLGRRIAVAEIIAALSVIFQKYSIELAVDEWATDEEVEKMSREERAKVYKKAQDKSRAIIASATSLITLKLHGDKYVSFRMVRRGEERFVDWMDS